MHGSAEASSICIFIHLNTELEFHLNYIWAICVSHLFLETKLNLCFYTRNLEYW